MTEIPFPYNALSRIIQFTLENVSKFVYIVMHYHALQGNNLRNMYEGMFDNA